MKNKLFNSFLILILLFILGFNLFKGFFTLGLCCDELSLLYEVVANLSNLKSVLRLFTGPYGSHYMFMYFGYLFFGFNAYYFFLTSLILRVLASFSLYFLGLKISKSKLVGLFISIWFVVGYAGIESTEGLNNSTTYLALVFINLGLILSIDYYKKYSKKTNLKKYLAIILMYFLAFISSPPRVSGIILTFFSIEIIILIFRKTNFRSFIVRSTLFVAMLLILKQVGIFRPEGTARLITENPISKISPFISNLGDVVNYILTNFYEIVFPPDLTLKLFSPQFTSVLIITLSLISIVYLFRKKNKFIAFYLSICLFSFFSFLLIYYLLDPVNDIKVHSRYLLISAQFIYIFYIFLSHVISVQLIKSSQKNIFIIFITKLIFVFLFILLFVSNYLSTKKFIEKRTYFRSGTYMEKAFIVINKELETFKSPNRPLVLITTNHPLENNDFIYWSILYGGKHRFMLRGFSEKKAPAFYSTENEIADILTNHEIASERGVPDSVIEDVFSYKVIDRELISETLQTRKRLEVMLKDNLYK